MRLPDSTATFARAFPFLLIAVCVLALLSVACHIELSSQPSDPEETEAATNPGLAPEGPPLSGQVAGQPFSLDDATLKTGILEVRQGEDFFADLEVTVFLFLDHGELPEGKVWNIGAGEQDDFDNPHVHVSYKDGSRNLPTTQIFADGYDLDLRFGQARGLQIPGEMKLRIRGVAATEIEGHFVAAVEGLVLRDGIADRQSDGIGTLQWVADGWLKEQEGEQIEIVDHHNTMFHHADEERGAQNGWVEVDYRATSDAALEQARLRLIKTEDGWAVHERFDASALRQAHPIAEPSPNEPFHYFPFVAARAIEAQLAGQAVYDAQFSTSYGRDDGYTEVTCRIGDPEAEPVAATYRFVLAGEVTWRLVDG